MATLLIERSSEFTNRIRNYGVYIDGKKVGVIANGETKEFDLSPGNHTLCCKIDWCSSPEVSFDSKDDTMKIFKVGGFKNAKWLMPIAGVIAGISFFVTFTGGNNKYFFYILFPVFLLLTYFVTIGRKKYLTLIEV